MGNEMLYLTTGHNNITALTQNVFSRKYVVKATGFDAMEITCSVDKDALALVVVDLKGVTARHFEQFKEIKAQIMDQYSLPIFLIGSVENNIVLSQFLQFQDLINLTNLKINEVYDEVMKHMDKVTRRFEKKTGTLKVMLVDDDPMILRYMGTALKETYNVIMAPSGMLAMTLLKKTNPKPDLILLDYQMPHMDGAQTLTKIRENDEFTNIPVFFLTGVNDKEAILKVMTLRPQGYILKTMPQKDILKQIDKFFEGN